MNGTDCQLDEDRTVASTSRKALRREMGGKEGTGSETARGLVTVFACLPVPSQTQSLTDTLTHSLSCKLPSISVQQVPILILLPSLPQHSFVFAVIVM